MWSFQTFTDRSPNFPLAEALGGSFAALIFLYIIINLFSVSRLESDVKPEDIKGIVQFNWPPDGIGYVVSCYSEKIRIEEEDEDVFLKDLFKPGNRFLTYSNEKFEYPHSNLIFLVYSGSTETFLAARKTLIDRFENCTISFMLLNKDMERSLYGRRVPAYLEAVKGQDSIIVKFREDLIRENLINTQ